VAGHYGDASMLLVGLTGGIGSGKTTVAAGFGQRGLAVVDADGISREIMEPSGLAYQPTVDHFGSGILDADGRIDRPALAAVVFDDAEALAALNRITHPLIGQVMADRVITLAADHAIVVLDIPLLSIATRDRFQLGAVVVVDTPEELAVARLVEQRGFTEADARARIAAQISRDREALESEIDRAVGWLRERAAAEG
jgi:dephospho-CoA kinase